MDAFTPSDLEKLARGEMPRVEVFQAILANKEAVRELDRLRMVCEFFEPPSDVKLDGASREDRLPMDVTFLELANYVQGKPMDAARQQAVERFLRKHFPDALRG